MKAMIDIPETKAASTLEVLRGIKTDLEKEPSIGTPLGKNW